MADELDLAGCSAFPSTSRPESPETDSAVNQLSSVNQSVAETPPENAQLENDINRSDARHSRSGGLLPSSSDSSDEEKRKPTFSELKKLVEIAGNAQRPDAQLDAVQRCRSLSSQENPPIDELIAAGILPVLVACLSPDINHELQFLAAWILTNITAGTSAQTNKVVLAGAVPLLLQLLSSPRENVREQALWALGNIIGNGPVLRDLVLEFGVVQRLLSIMKSNIPITILRTVSWLVRNICSNKDPPPPLKTIKELLPALNALIINSDVSVLIESVQSISRLADCGNIQIQIVIESGIVPKLVPLLSHKDVKVRTAALRAVGNIATGTDEQTQVLIECGALSYCKALLSFENEKEKICKEAMWFLSNVLAGNKAQAQAVIDARLLPRIVEGLSVGSFQTRREAAWAVFNLSNNGSAQQFAALLAAGVIPPFCDQLTSENAELVNVVLDGLDSILKMAGERVAPMIAECGGLDKIKALKDTHKIASQIIKTYFDNEAKFIASNTSQGSDTDLGMSLLRLDNEKNNILRAHLGTAHAKYGPVPGTDVVVKFGSTQTVRVMYKCITFMKEYEKKSLEELRFEDYAAGRKGAANPPAFGFSQPEAKPLFGGRPFGQSNTTSGKFGTTTSTAAAPLFEASTAPASMFGASTAPASMFGASTAPASMFGAPTATASMFGESTAPASMFGASTAPASMFGASTAPASMFGASTAPASMFGAPTAPASMFGASTAPASMFGASTAPASMFGGASNITTSMFRTSTATAPVSGASSAPASAFGASTAPASMFGASTAPAKMFGASTSTASLFGGASNITTSMFRTSTATAPVSGASSAPASAFGASTAPASMFGASTAPATMFEASTAPASMFGASNTTASVFGTSTATAPLFGTSTVTAPVCGASTLNTTAPVFGASTAPASLFKTLTTTAPGPSTATASLFGASTAAAPVCRASNSTTTAPVFGASTAPASLFKTLTTTAPGASTAAAPVCLASNSTTTAPVFGASTAPASLFKTSTTTAPGASTAAAPVCLASNSTTTAPVFGASTAPASLFKTSTTTAPGASTDTASLFGASTAAAPVCKASNSTTTAPVFGASTAPASLFKTSTTTAPGASTAAAPVCLASNSTTTAPVFGASTAPASLFKTSTTTAPGASTAAAPVCLASNSTTTAPVFGASTAPASLFKTSTTTAPGASTAAAPLFGASTATASLFGASTAAAPLLGASTATAPAFGAKPADVDAANSRTLAAFLAEDLSQLRPLQIHQIVEGNVRVEEGTVTIQNPPDSNVGFGSRPIGRTAYVFSLLPVMIDQIFKIESLTFSNVGTTELSVGFTSADPDRLNLFDLPVMTYDLLDRLEYWQFDMFDMKAGSLMMMVKMDGEVLVMLGSEGRRSFFIDVGTTLWFFVHSNGGVDSFKISTLRQPTVTTTEFPPLPRTNSPLEPSPKPLSTSALETTIHNTDRSINQTDDIGTDSAKASVKKTDAPVKKTDASVKKTEASAVNPSTSDSTECWLCMYRQVNAALVDCGHCLCYECATKIKSRSNACPICGKVIQKVMRLFI